MTIPGGMMKQSVGRLKDAIQAAKEAAADTRNAVAAQEFTPVAIEQEKSGDGPGAEQGPA